MKRIGVLTSGGDAPGMNAAVRSVVRMGIYSGLEVVGIQRGFSGLLEGDFHPLGVGSVADIIHRGGTMLLTARSDEFLTEEGQKKAFKKARGNNIDGLIVIGGNGSLQGALTLNKRGLPAIGIPGTIDNDIACTEYTIGFDTAVNTVVEAINKIRDTATSHERVFVLEVMGRHSGQLTLMAGIAGGAESLLIPEHPWSMQEVVDKILRGRKRGKKHSIILVAEGVGSAFDVGREITRLSGLETRVVILGHIQRGGTPTAFDRMLASRMGVKSVDLLIKGISNRLVGIVGNRICDFDLEAVLQERKGIDLEVYRLAGILSI
ncbi:MAG TPA: 6-phosphofructokinase [Clostridia bacterium]|nr:6-phosphofructokinase [Clostridia bacterium]